MVGKWFGFERDEVFAVGLNNFNAGDFDEAAKAFEACLDQGSNHSNGEVKLYLGRCYEALAVESLSNEDFCSAAGLAENAIRVLGELPDIHLLAAKAYAKGGMRGLAMLHAKKALAMQPCYEEASRLFNILATDQPSIGPTDSQSLSAEEQQALELAKMALQCSNKRLDLESRSLYERAV